MATEHLHKGAVQCRVSMQTCVAYTSLLRGLWLQTLGMHVQVIVPAADSRPQQRAVQQGTWVAQHNEHVRQAAWQDAHQHRSMQERTTLQPARPVSKPTLVRMMTVGSWRVRAAARCSRVPLSSPRGAATVRMM